MANTNPPILRRGQFVEVTVDGRTLRAMVVLASDNARSVLLMFDGLLGGYVGTMPVIWVVDRYEDLIRHEAVRIVLQPEE
jgi:hypothetical protein